MQKSLNFNAFSSVPKVSCNFILLVLSIMFAAGQIANAQTENATLTGRVTDSNGGLVPGVQLEVRNNATNFSSAATTDSYGLYIITNLRPGSYELFARKQGFQTVLRKSIQLYVQDVVVMDLSLQVESVAESLTVRDEGRGFEISPSTNTIIKREFIANLPLNGRSFQSLLEISPGVVLTKADSESPGQISVNGQRANANYFTVDGVSANIGVSAGISPNQYASGSLPGFSTFGGTSNLVSIDALQEFKIHTSTYAPEFGRVPGGQVSIVTRSGSNLFHGAVFEYFRNDVLDANDWFANSRGLRRAALRQNNFGGVVGGPVRKDHTFFFLSYEGLRLRQPQTKIVAVPSIDVRRIAPLTMRPFLNAFPKPNGATLANGFAEFSGSYSDPSTLDSTSLRLDHVISERVLLFGRSSYSPSESKLRRSALSSVTTSEFSSRSLTVGTTLALSHSQSNELRLNWSDSRGASFTRADNFGGAEPLPHAFLFPPSSSQKNSFFTLIIRGGTDSSIPVGENAHNVQRQFNLVNNFSLIVGSHHLKFGIDYRRLRPTFDPRIYDQEVTLNGLSGALNGKAAEVLIQGQYSIPTFGFTNLSIFAQDVFRVSPKLTLTYGVRWEHNPPPSETAGNDPFTIDGLETPATMTLAPRGTPLWKNTYLDFAPRFGLAYQISKTPRAATIIRTAAGLYYDLGNGLAANSAGFGIFPFSRIKFLFDVPFPLTPALASAPAFSLDPPFGFLFVYDRKHKLPVSYQWNVAFDQSLGSQSISVSYVGVAGRRLLRQELLVQPNPLFDFVFVTRNAAKSDYHAFQAQFLSNFSKRLQLLASYSLAHSIDTISNESSFFNIPVSFSDPNQDRGPSDFDVRHTFTGAVTYNIPGWEKAGIGGRNWSLDAIVRIRSATPVNLVTGSNFLFGFFDVRPNRNLGVPLYISDPLVAGRRKINRDAFSLPANGRQGSLGRNALRGFGMSQIDLAARREFQISDAIKFQFRIEAFNVLNHPNFANPVNNLSSNLFGQSIQVLGRSLGSGAFAGGFNPVYQVGGPRSLQLALRVEF